MEQSGFSISKRSFRGIFNGLCSVILFFYLFNRADIHRSPLLISKSSLISNRQFYLPNSGNGSVHNEIIRRRTAQISDNSSHLVTGFGLDHASTKENPVFCDGLVEHVGFSTQCEYLKAHPECSTGGFFDYLQFFYCDCQRLGVLGYAILGVWLVALFYLLGNTAADYFCFSLEKLSSILNLPPTVAGVTLLPFGNGATDVFASIAAFMGTGASDVGLNSVLGGAVFITFVVVGTVSFLIANKRVQIDRTCFIRDLSFFIIGILSLLWILAVGKVTVGAAIAYLMIYVVYAFVVGVTEMLKKQTTQSLKSDPVTPLLPVKERTLSQGSGSDEELPQCTMWGSTVAIYSNQSLKLDDENPPWGWNNEDGEAQKSLFSCPKLFAIVEIPLAIPRKLTIPMVQEETWSKPYFVASVSLAPILLVFLWIIRDNPSSLSKEVACIIGVAAGSMFGVLAYRYTEPDQPPERFLLQWVLGGFFMSIVWFYIIASELVALLVGIGVILGINPSLLGLTILAWGNSMGDMVSNVALAMNGADGVQIALSGCYAGPMFNTLIGLGVSLLLGATSTRPTSYVLPKDSSLFYTIGFLLTGLIWAIVVLLWKDMRPNKVLGVGLMFLYLVFLLVGVANGI